MTDLRFAVRMLTRSPGFVAIAILTLALGIGANTAIFSVVNGVLLRPLPFHEPERIVSVYTSTADEQRSNHSAGDFRDFLRENQSFAALAGYRTTPFTTMPRPGEPILLVGAFVTIGFFDVLGVHATSGRVFSRTTDDAGAERLVVLGEEAARQLYGSTPQAVGQHLRVDSESYTVAGTLPAGAEWPHEARIWVLSRDEVPPSPVDQEDPADRDVRYFEAVGRLKPGVTLAQADQDLARLSGIHQQRHPATSRRRDYRMTPLREAIVGDVRFGLIVLQSAVGLVLLIACANVSSLMLARATGRTRELAIRAALGAGRGRLIRQLLTESLMLGMIGGLAGLLVGAWLTVLLVRVLPASVPRSESVSLDYVVALATFATALVTGMLFGVMPALQASRVDAAAALKRGGERGSVGRARTRAALVVAEVALTLVLLAGAGLLLNSFLRLQRVDSGLEPENVTLVPLIIPQARYTTGPAQTTIYRRVLEGLQGQPEVQAAGVGFPGPLRGSNAAGSFFIEGRNTADSTDRPFANIGSVSGGYFAAMGIPLVSGRTFKDSDTADAQPVAVVSVALARKYWPGEDAIGKRVRFDESPKEPAITIVGIVGDVKQLGLAQEAPPILYFPYEQFPLPFTNVAVRSTAPQGTIASLVRDQLKAIDPELPPGNVATLQGVLDRSVAQPRFRTALVSAFALVALVLAAVGVYGLISYSVTQRTREIGIRIALGARPDQVIVPMIREGLGLALAGTALGLLGALVSGRVIASFLFGIGTTDPLTFASVGLVLLTVAFVATYIPSRRALRVDPVTALRAE